MRVLLLFLILFSIAPFVAVCQNNAVSILEENILAATSDRGTLDSIAKHVDRIYNLGEFDKAYEWLKKGTELAKNLEDNYNEDSFKVLTGRYFARNKRLNEALTLINEVMHSNDKYFKEYTAHTYTILSRIHQQSNGMDSALFYNYLADSIFQKTEPSRRFYTLMDRSDILAKQGLKKKAIEAAEKSEELFNTPSDTINHLWLLYRISTTMYNYGELEKYSIYAKKYIELSKLRKSKFHRGIFDLDVPIDKHIADLEQVLTFYKDSNYQRGYYLALEKLANLLIKAGKNKAAYDAILRLEPNIKKNNFENSILETLEKKFDLEKKLGLESEALKTVSELISVRDSVQKESFAKQSLELETQYKTREKEQEILILSKENQVQELNIQRSRMTKWILSIGGLALLLFSLYLFRNVKSKKRINETLEEKNSIINKNLEEKETLLKEIHHRVKNNLQIISSLLRLQSRTVEDPDTKEVLMEGQNRVQSMALIHQNLYKEDNLTGVEVKKYIEKLSKNLLETYNISENDIRLKLDIAPVSLDVSTLIPLGLIVNEIFTNSLKYAFDNKKGNLLGLSLYLMNDILFLHVYDNGKGISDEMINYLNENSALSRNKDWGFGTRLLKTFSKKLDAKINASNEQGTRIEFQILNYTIT